MTAHALATAPRIRNSRTARAATQRRIVAQQRNRYSAMRTAMLVVVGVMVVLFAEVVLTADITANAYSLDRAHAQRAALQMETERLDDQIAGLTSDDRLSAVAAKLGMVQPQRFIRISLRTPDRVRARPLAFLPLR
jgi:cell division protein FtsL